MVRIWWTSLVVDITSTIYETTHMVLFDHGAAMKTQSALTALAIREHRAKAIQRLGEIWMLVTPDESLHRKDKVTVQHLYEEAALAAMLETIQRKDEASHSSSE
jgi:hypothetical protein